MSTQDKLAKTETESTDAEARFAAEADAKSQGLAKEFFSFLRHNKKWWLTPIILVLLLVGVLVVLGGSVLGPFIYPLF